MNTEQEALHNLDVRTLRLLSKIIETANITRAGETLGYSQPAASRAVDRLRQTLGDPLLVRTSRGYVPTAKAATLRPLVEEMLLALDRVFADSTFDPATSTRTFTIASTDYGHAAILSDWIARVAKAAPNTRTIVVPFGPNTFHDLEFGVIDAALIADDDLPADLHRKVLFEDDYACVVRNGHPALSMVDSSMGDILEVLVRWPQVVVSYPNGDKLVPDEVLSRMGASHGHVMLEVPYFMSAPCVLASTDAVMCLPTRAAIKVAHWGGLGLIRLPGSPTFRYVLIWHPRNHRDLGLQWFRSLTG